MKFTITSLVLILFVDFYGFSQSEVDFRQPDYLLFQTGLMIDGYNSMGVRTFFEYQKDIKGNWQYGISYENSRHLTSAATDHLNELPTNLDILSINGYYKLNLLKDRLFWTAGVGFGGVHAYWNDRDKFGLVANASITLNIRITKRIYFESSPLVVFLPSNRLYLSSMNIDTFDGFYAFTFFPFGIKVKL